MSSLINSRSINLILLITVLGEFVIPWILKHFYKEYDSKKMVMSVLGSPESPVRKFYNVWLIWLGLFLLFISFPLFIKINTVSKTLAILTFISVVTFSVGAGIISGSFSVNESKENVTFTSKIHGISSAIGFMTLLFFPLLRCITAFMTDDIIQGTVCMAAFVLAVLFFTFFIISDKDNFKGTVFSYAGLWEQLSLFFMYMPFLYDATTNLFGVNGL